MLLWVNTALCFNTRLSRRSPRQGSHAGLAALKVAQAEIGHGEEGSDNHGPDIKKYFAGYGNQGKAGARPLSVTVLTGEQLRYSAIKHQLRHCIIK